MKDLEYKTFETAWCAGCGNFSILSALRDALEELGKKPHDVVIVGGIGQAAKLPQYINTNGFCGLHGRALPVAAGAKIANKDLTVIVNTGDGDSYGEGGNHFIHNIRRNVDIAHFVHDNQIYGLTKGQASPTTNSGHKTKVQPMGSKNMPLNPLLIALSLGAGFVARAFTGDQEQLKEIMKEAINYKGYALVDILQPCVSFNKVNTHKWYKDRVYPLDKAYDSSNKMSAIEKSMEFGDKIPTGIIYKSETEDFHSHYPYLQNGSLIDMKHDMTKIQKCIEDFI